MGNTVSPREDGSDCSCDDDWSKASHYGDSKIKIFVEVFAHKREILEVFVNPMGRIQAIKFEIEKMGRWPAGNAYLMNSEMQEMEYGYTLSKYNIQNESTLRLVICVTGGGVQCMAYNKASQEVIISGSPNIRIASFHVSCRSDQIGGDNMAGAVLYSYDDKTDWRLNNVHCKSGYIVLRTTKKIKHIQAAGAVHGACYKSVFGQDVNDKVVGGGFAYVGCQWKFNSGVFNIATKYHDGQRKMNEMEEQCIKAAMQNWRSGVQNTSVSSIAKQYHWQ